MLILSRRLGETIVLTPNSLQPPIRVTVADIQGDKVRLAIEAPETVPVDRLEVHLRKKEGQTT